MMSFHCILVFDCRLLFFFWFYCVTTVTPSFYERSNNGYAIKPKKKNAKTTIKHQNAVEYIAGNSFSFISFKKK